MVILSWSVPASTHKSLWWRDGEQQVFVRTCVRESGDLQYKDSLIRFKLMLLSMLMILLIAGRMDPLTQKPQLRLLRAVGTCGGLIKLPAPRERLLAWSGMLQHNLEHRLFQGGCWGTDFSIAWAYAFTALTSCLKSARPVSKRWTRSPLRSWQNAVFKHSVWTVVPRWPFRNSGWNFHHLSFAKWILQRWASSVQLCCVVPCDPRRERQKWAHVDLLLESLFAGTGVGR